jgi:hypothetical protein
LNTQRTRLAAAALASGLLACGTAFASKVFGVPITGHVTAVSGVEAVTIDGTQYLVRSDSQAAQALPGLKPGELVTIVLDGPPSSAAHVIAVHAAASAAQ